MDGSLLVGSPLLWGLVLGVRHAADADHMAVMATIVAERASLRQALRSASLWGFGHSFTVLAVGTAIVVFGLKIPRHFELAVDFCVGASLFLLGADQLHRLLRRREGARKRGRDARPLALGSIHGLAGSAAIALLALATIRSDSAALLYLVLFGVGTVLGMLAVTFLLAWSFKASTSLASLHRGLVFGSGLVSTALGLFMLARLWQGTLLSAIR